MTDLTNDEVVLLKWLKQEDFSQYGECHGKTLDNLVAKGFVQIHEPGQHQSFIAKGDGLMYRAVSVTDAGHEAFKAGASRQWAADQAKQLNAECELEIERLHGKPA